MIEYILLVEIVLYRIIVKNKKLRLLGGIIINKYIRLIRNILVILSCLLFIFGIFALVFDFSISNSELLPLIASSNLAMFLLFIYWALGMGSIKSLRTPENKIIRILSKVGFGGNIVLTILCIFFMLPY